MKILGVAAIASFFAAAAFVPASAQPPGGAKEPVVHVAWAGLEAGTTEETVILGPLPAGTTFEIFDMTTVNRGGDPLMVQYRLIEPDTEDCLTSGVVIDEIMRVAVPGLDSLHQVFSESLEVPGQWANSIMVVVAPSGTEPLCIIAFLPSDSIFPKTAGDKAEGRMTLRINPPD